jgi:hypothetical protein
VCRRIFEPEKKNVKKKRGRAREAREELISAEGGGERDRERERERDSARDTEFCLK